MLLNKFTTCFNSVSGITPNYYTTMQLLTLHMSDTAYYYVCRYSFVPSEQSSKELPEYMDV